MSRKARAFRTECDHLAAEGARQALSVGLVVRPSAMDFSSPLTVELVGSNFCSGQEAGGLQVGRRSPWRGTPLKVEHCQSGLPKDLQTLTASSRR